MTIVQKTDNSKPIAALADWFRLRCQFGGKKTETETFSALLQLAADKGIYPETANALMNKGKLPSSISAGISPPKGQETSEQLQAREVMIEVARAAFSTHNLTAYHKEMENALLQVLKAPADPLALLALDVLIEQRKNTISNCATEFFSHQNQVVALHALKFATFNTLSDSQEKVAVDRLSFVIREFADSMAKHYGKPLSTSRENLKVPEQALYALTMRNPVRAFHDFFDLSCRIDASPISTLVLDDINDKTHRAWDARVKIATRITDYLLEGRLDNKRPIVGFPKELLVRMVSPDMSLLKKIREQSKDPHLAELANTISDMVNRFA